MKTRTVKIKINLTHGSTGYAGFEIHSVVISTDGRINFRDVNACEDGEWYTVTRWDREDGKTDMYSDIYEEAAINRLN
jgi:hypothetical protein